MSLGERMTATALCTLAWLASATPAFSGGMVLPIRGVRTLERGGAFVAGADDADALWQNPAGLAHGAGQGTKQLLFDIALVYQPVEYTRIDSAGNVQPAVDNQQPGAPIPTLAASFAIDDKLVIAGGITAPYAGLHRYAEDGAQRYASVSLTGSTFVLITVGGAYAISDQLRVGATLQDVVSNLDARVVVSGCPGQTMCSPDDRSFDTLAQIQQSDYVAPTASLGIQYDAHERITLGAAIQGPSRVSSPGTLALPLPTNALFENAQVVGDKVRMSFTLPPVVRAGIELRPSRALRVEAALDVELWSLHDEIAIAPDDVRIENVGGTTYSVGTMAIPRNYKTSLSPSLGVEYHREPVMFGAGISYETAAAPAAYVSTLAVDAAKILVGIGGGYEEDGWQIGAAVGYAKLSDVDVPLATAAVPQLQPIRDEPAPGAVNAGTYKSSYLIAGLRVARRF